MNNAEMQKKIEELEKKIADLMSWKERKDAQQLSYPLDEASREIINGI
jgi:hypothetical protein